MRASVSSGRELHCHVTRMTPVEPNGNAAASVPSLEQQAEAAELAAKVAALPHGPVRRHGWFWWICHLVLSCVALGLLAAALARVFYHDGTHLLTWINAFTRYFYLPAYVCLAWAIWMRRWLLAALSIAVVGFHLTWMAPDFLRDRRFDAVMSTVSNSSDETPKVRIFFANVLATNHDFTPLWKEIEEANPDVVVLAECTQFSDRSFRDTSAMASYVNGKTRRQTQIGEVRIFSRLPIRSESQSWAAGRVLQTVDLEAGGQTLRLIGLHAPRPQKVGYDYFGYWKKVVPQLIDAQRPLVVIGDFNATQNSLVYKQLQEGGLRSAHDDRGRGYALTWPNGRLMMPPIRIDQAFLSPEVECLDIREGRGEGSDHKPLIVDLRIRAAD
jgi:endonuclease/exonuclease/phosphatase (EEP) superfamily protein YafD